MLCMLFFVFSIHKIVRPADTDKTTNSAQHPKSLGTADLYFTLSQKVPIVQTRLKANVDNKAHFCYAAY